MFALGVLLAGSSYQIYLEWDSQRVDLEKINHTLVNAIANKTSPFELEPGWGRLADILAEHLDEHADDTTARLYRKLRLQTECWFRTPMAVFGFGHTLLRNILRTTSRGIRRKSLVLTFFVAIVLLYFGTNLELSRNVF